MRAFDSSVGRLLLVVATVAIGMETMRSQSTFWLGVLATLTVLWLVHALATAIAERGPRRTFCVVFAVSAIAFLGACFGPWSDASFRGDVSDPNYTTKIAQRGLPTTRALARFAARQVKPMVRGSIEMVDRSGRPAIEIDISQRSGSYRDLGQLTDDLDVAARVHMGMAAVFRPQGYPTHVRSHQQTFDIYFDAAYLLLSLGFGALAGCIPLLLRWTPLRNHRSPAGTAGRRGSSASQETAPAR